MQKGSKQNRISSGTLALSIRTTILLMLLFFAGKPVFEFCAHFFDDDVEVCEFTGEEDSEEKEMDDYEEDNVKLFFYSITELPIIENQRSVVIDRFESELTDFKPGIQTPPPEYTFNV